MSNKNSNIYFYNSKYLKYKNKYLNLKRMLGGGEKINIICLFHDEKHIFTIINDEPLIQTIASILKLDHNKITVFFLDKKVEIGDTAINLGINSNSIVKIFKKKIVDNAENISDTIIKNLSNKEEKKVQNPNKIILWKNHSISNSNKYTTVLDIIENDPNITPVVRDENIHDHKSLILTQIKKHMLDNNKEVVKIESVGKVIPYDSIIIRNPSEIKKIKFTQDDFNINPFLYLINYDGFVFSPDFTPKCTEYTMYIFTPNKDEIIKLSSSETNLQSPEYIENKPYEFEPVINICGNNIPYYSIYSKKFNSYIYYKITEWLQEKVDLHSNNELDDFLMKVSNNGVDIFQPSLYNSFNYVRHKDLSKYMTTFIKEKQDNFENIYNINNKDYKNDTFKYRLEMMYEKYLEINFNSIYKYPFTQDQIDNINIDVYRNIKIQDPWKTKKQFDYIVTHENKIKIEQNNLDKSLYLKLHLNVQFKYFFWTLETIIKNKNKFNMNGLPLFYYCKFNCLFSQDIVLPDLAKLGNEILYEANVVFYLDDKENCKFLIKILQEIFPPNLHYISSNKIPRFNIRINPLIYLGLGDGSHKEDLVESELENGEENTPKNKYKTFDEYLTIMRKCKDNITEKTCLDANIFSKNISGHNLCVWDEKGEPKCSKNTDIKTHKYITRESDTDILKLITGDLDLDFEDIHPYSE